MGWQKRNGDKERRFKQKQKHKGWKPSPMREVKIKQRYRNDETNER